MIGRFLVGGAVNATTLAVIAFLLSRFAGDVVGRFLLVIFLFIAGGAYVGFAVGAGVSPPWAAAEVPHAVVLGTMGLLGLRGSASWIAAGWALHPLWDAALHYFGPGRSVAPASWAISCVSFDLVLAGYLAMAYGLGLVGDRRPAIRHRAT
jgi:hypothetical protein